MAKKKNGEWYKDPFRSRSDDESRIGTYRDENGRLVIGGDDGVAERRGTFAFGGKNGVGARYQNKFSTPESQNRYAVGYTAEQEVEISVGIAGLKIHGLDKKGVNLDGFIGGGYGGALFIGGEINAEAAKTFRWEW